MKERSSHAVAAQAIEFLCARTSQPPSLAETAREVGLSEFHFQRTFQREVGVSPKRFLQVLTLQRAKQKLGRDDALLPASLELGLSGPSRLHDLFVSLERMTPGEWQRQAKGLLLRWDLVQTPLGPALLTAAPRGLCGVAFVADERAAQEELQARWPLAQTARDPAALAPAAQLLLARLSGRPAAPVGLSLKGTELQLRVWEALLRIPEGQTVSYGALAHAAGSARAVRAVASAVAANPVAVLIPCHRVIRATGALGEYRWGAPRKSALLALETARAG